MILVSESMSFGVKEAIKHPKLILLAVIMNTHFANFFLPIFTFVASSESSPVLSLMCICHVDA